LVEFLSAAPAPQIFGILSTAGGDERTCRLRFALSLYVIRAMLVVKSAHG
jgi:hypothetical protein